MSISMELSGVVPMSLLDFEIISLKFHNRLFSLVSASFEHCPFGMLTFQCLTTSAGGIIKSVFGFLFDNQCLHCSSTFSVKFLTSAISAYAT